MSDLSADQGEWNVIEDDDPIYDPPTGAPPYVADPLVDALPYRQLNWEAFEKLLVRVASHVEGLIGVRRYGTGGQRQHGIDVVGWTGSGDAQVLQGKDVRSFDEDDLAKAVEIFRQGKRPFSPTRLIFGVAVPARRTQVVEGIEAARVELEIGIDLYDADRLDELLRNHPRIVEEFFGKTVADRFCSSTPTPSQVAIVGVDPAVRAFATGPIRALGLQEEERGALALQDPAERARALLVLADKLSESGWEPNARTLRRQARSLLTEATGRAPDPGLAEELANLSLTEAISALLRGDATGASLPARTLAGLAGIQPMAMSQAGREPAALPNQERWHTRAVALLAATDALREPYPGMSGSLLQFRLIVQQLIQEEDVLASELAMILGELTIAAEAEPMSLVVLDRLDGASVVLLGGDEQGRQIGARLACVIAEMRGAWGDIVDRARRSELDPWGAALVMARYARWAAITGRLDEAKSAWQEATRWAGEAKLSADAASWMRCLIQIRMREATFDPGVQDLAATATALAERPSGDRLMPDVDSEWRQALGALAEEPPDIRTALEPLVRIRWAYAASGDLRQELAAVSRIGDLLRSAGEYDAALEQYIRASAHDEAKALATGSGDRVLRVAAHMSRPLQNQRATAYLAVSEGGDLVPDEEIDVIGSLALADVIGVLGGTVRDTQFSPNLLKSAIDALAALADRLSEEVLIEAVRAMEPSLDRPEGQYAWTDDGLFVILARLAARQDVTRSTREDAARSLARAALAMPHVNGNPNELIRLRDEHPDLSGPIEGVLLPAAAAGTQMALLILSDHPSVHEFVRKAAEAALQRVTSFPASTPGQIGIGVSYGQDVWLIRTLDDKARLAATQGLIALAARTDDVLVNRESALAVVPSLVLSLDDATRQALFEQLIPFGRGEHDEVTVGLDFGPQHPLSSIQFNLGPSSLIPSGLRAASTCAMTEASQAEVAELAIAELRSRGPAELHDLVTALATISSAALRSYLPLLVRDSRDDLRALAAVGWTQAPAEFAIGEVLAHDHAAIVRRTLATNLHAVATTAEATDQRWPAWSGVLEFLAQDVRASVRQLARMALARVPGI
jgi:tetratricopeptide (TPR) repeat protein